MSQRRPTRQRAAVSQALAGSQEFRSAQDLHARVLQAGHQVGLATVYRTLQAMSTDGEIDVLLTDGGEAVYRACETEQHHHHLVCRECGRTVEVEGSSVERWTAKIAAEHGFTDVSHTVEVFGVCDRHRPGIDYETF